MTPADAPLPRMASLLTRKATALRSFSRTSDTASFAFAGIPAVMLKVGFPGEMGAVFDSYRKSPCHTPSDDMQQPVNLETLANSNRLRERWCSTSPTILGAPSGSPAACTTATRSSGEGCPWPEVIARHWEVCHSFRGVVGATARKLLNPNLIAPQ